MMRALVLALPFLVASCAPGQLFHQDSEFWDGLQDVAVSAAKGAVDSAMADLPAALASGDFDDLLKNAADGAVGNALASGSLRSMIATAATGAVIAASAESKQDLAEAVVLIQEKIDEGDEDEDGIPWEDPRLSAAILALLYGGNKLRNGKPKVT